MEELLCAQTLVHSNNVHGVVKVHGHDVEEEVADGGAVNLPMMMNQRVETDSEGRGSCFKVSILV